MKPSLAPLTALRAFEASGRHLSFTKAAAELGVTPAAVSQLVRQLEDHVGGKLFARSTRSIRLTERGRAAWPHLRDGFDAIHTGARMLLEDGERNTITVSVGPSFGSCWLLPRLSAFRAAYPGISVRLDAREGLADFGRDEVDIAIRNGEGRYQGLHSDLLLKDVAFVVCAPALLDGGRPFRHPRALKDRTLIHVDWQVSRDAAPSWPRWVAHHQVAGLDVTGGLRFSLEEMALRAALAGMGYALLTEAYVGDELASGRLRRALPQSFDMPTRFHHYLVYPKSHAQKYRTVALFRDWLLDQARIGRT